MTEFIIVNKFRFTWLYKLKKELWKITSLYKKVSHVARVGSDKRRNSSMQLNGCGRVLRIDYSLPAAEAAVGNAGAVAVQSDRRFRVNVLIPTCCWCCLAVRILPLSRPRRLLAVQATATISACVQKNGVFRGQLAMTPLALKICTILLPKTS